MKGLQLSVGLNFAASWKLYNRDGSLIDTGTKTITDRDGNYFSTTVSTNTTFTDTLGGTVLTVSGSGTSSSPIQYSYTSAANTSVSFTAHYTSYTVKTSFGCSGISEYGPISNPLVSDVTLPDGSKYLFTYEPTPGDSTKTTGRLQQVTLPTGGTITYTYTGGNNGVVCADGSAAGLTRQLNPGGTWTYSRSGSGNSWTTTVADPASPTNETVINFSKDANTTNPTSNFYETQRLVYQGSHTSGTLLMTAYNCWNNNFTNCPTQSVSSPISQLDAYRQPPGVSAALSETKYDSNGRVTENKEYDFGSVLVSDTSLSYASLGNILDKPSVAVVKDSSNNVVAQTTYTYDEGSVATTSGTPQHTSVSGSRGNLTTLATQVNATQTLYRHFAYYDTGTLNTSTDVNLSSTANGSTTAYVYGSGTSCGNSFPTQINLPLSLSRSMTWNCTGGVQVQTTDENGATSSLDYLGNGADPFWRPQTSTDPLGNVTTLYYSQGASLGSTWQASRMVFNNGLSEVERGIGYDMFYRPVLYNKQQANGSSTYDSVVNTYDTSGRLSTTSMPCATTTWNCPTPVTNQSYDALNRPTSVTDAGGGTVSYRYTNNDVLQTLGPAPTGEHTKQKQLEYDGLGRLISVCEVTSGSGSACAQSNVLTGYWTRYRYDALGRLTGVCQNTSQPYSVDCVANPSTGQQTRSFAYDMLGRMTSETNPENGQTTYAYDTLPTGCWWAGTQNAGDLASVTKNDGTKVCYLHDSIHRLTDAGPPTGYSSSNPCVRFRYDNSQGVTGTRPTGVTVSNSLGRPVEAETDSCPNWPPTPVTDEWLSYSARGEVTDVYESTPHSAGYYHLTQSYWEHGGLKALSGLPGLPTITYGATDGSGLDGEGRVTKISASSGTNPLTATTYTLSGTSQPIGSLTQLTFGSSDTDSFSYDPNTGRMQQYQFNVGSGGSNTPTFVQSTNREQNANATSFSTAFTSNVTSGHLLFVTFANTTANSISTISDTLGNTYTALPVIAANGYRLQAFYTYSIASGADTVTGTYSGSGATYIQETLAEYSNVGTIDVHAENSGGNSPPSTTTTTTASSDLVIGYVTDSFVTWTGESGWNLRTTASGIRAALQDTIAANPGSITSTFNTVNGWNAGIVAFKPTSSGGSNKGVLNWNANGTLQQLAITDPFNSANTQTCNFTYDDLARQSTANCGTAWNQSFSFDLFGNISKSATVGTSFNATYSSATNRITTIGSLVPTYDANGNLLNDTAHAYTWDAYGRMLTVDSGTANGVCDTYDAFGRMVEKATGASCTSSYTETVYAPSGLRLATMTGQTMQQASVPLLGGSEVVYNSSGLLAYRHSDHLGSSRFASTPSRTKYFDVAYAPYGENYGGSGTTDLSFTGQKQDTASWLYDFMFRKYNPAHGRWMSPDPAGIGAADPATPQSWNRYAYVGNNPLSGVDALGLDYCLENNCPGGASGGGGGWGEWGGATWGAEGPWGDGVNYAGGSQGGAGFAACGVDIYCIHAGGLGPFDSPLANVICDRHGSCRTGSWSDATITPGGIYYNAGVQTDFYTKSGDYLTSIISKYINLVQFSGGASADIVPQFYSWGDARNDVASGLEYAKTHPVFISVNEIGALQYTAQWSTKTVCINVGVGASVPPTKMVTVGLYNAGNMANWTGVLSSWGYSFGSNLWAGYQASTNSSGTIGAPTLTLGAGLSGSYTYGGCKTF